MPIINIVSRYDSACVLFECEVPADVPSGLAVRHALERATQARANLRGANLRDAYLSGANLSDANLSDAYLRDANLRGANLRGANLRDAYLSGADLSGADLSGAYLSGANLRDAYLSGADLSGFKADFFDVLLRAPREIPALRGALVAGRVDGSVYEGECACLVGTIANARCASFKALGNGLVPNAGRPAERWFMSISIGDTPGNSSVSRITVEWLDEFAGLLAAATAPQSDGGGCIVSAWSNCQGRARTHRRRAANLCARARASNDCR